MIPVLFVNFIVLQAILVDGVTDAPRPSLFPTTSKELLDFDVPISLVGAEKLALQSSKNQKLASHEVSRSVAYSLPFDRHHFAFDRDDWTVYDLPNSDEQMIVSSSHVDPAKELNIETTIKAFSNVIIRYQVHLTSEGTPVKPTLSVYLIANGTKTHLKEETPSELWSNSSITVNTGPQSQLLFVGILRSEGNKIALRSFSFEILSQAEINRYAIPTYASAGLRIPQIAELPNFHEAPGPEYNIFTGSDIQGASSQNVSPPNFQIDKTEDTDVQYTTKNNETFVSEDSSVYNESSIESSNILVNFSTSNNFPTGEDKFPDFHNFDDSNEQTHSTPGKSNTSDSSTISSEIGVAAGSNSDLIHPYVQSTTAIPGLISSNSSSSEAPSDSSSASTVFNFFVVVFVCALLVVAFLWWRRRRNRADDEIPVFSRSATEHGNPTFLDDETQLDPGLTSDTPTNYRSFE